MRHKKLTLTILTALLAAVSVTAGEETPFTDLARLVPADAAIYVEFRDLAQLRSDCLASATYARLKDTNVYQELIGSPGWIRFQDGVAEIETAHNLRREDVIEDVFGAPVSVAVRKAADAETAEHPEVLALFAGDNLERYLDIITEGQQAEGKIKESSESTYKGHTVFTKVVVETTKKGDLREKTEHYVFAGKALMISSHMDYLEAALDCLSDSKLPSVATEATLVKAARELPAGARVLAVTREAPILRHVLSKHPAARNMRNPVAANLLAAVRAYVTSISTNAVGVYSDLSVRAVWKTTHVSDKLTGGMRRLFTFSESSASALDLLPARTLGAYHVNVDPNDLVAMVREAAPAEQRPTTDGVLLLANAFTGSAATDPNAPPKAPDVLGSEFALACVRRFDNEGPPNVVLVAALSDQADAQARLAGAIGATTTLIAVDHRQKGKPFSVGTETVGGVTIHTFGPIGGFTTAYAFISPYVVLSNDVAIVRDIAGKTSSLATTTAFKGILAGSVPRETLYLDVAAAADLLDDYRETVIAGEVKKGKKPEEQIRKETAILAQLLKLCGTAHLSTHTDKDSFTCTLEITPAPPTE